MSRDEERSRSLILILLIAGQVQLLEGRPIPTPTPKCRLGNPLATPECYQNECRELHCQVLMPRSNVVRRQVDHADGDACRLLVMPTLFSGTMILLVLPIVYIMLRREKRRKSKLVVFVDRKQKEAQEKTKLGVNGGCLRCLSFTLLALWVATMSVLTNLIHSEKGRLLQPTTTSRCLNYFELDLARSTHHCSRSTLDSLDLVALNESHWIDYPSNHSDPVLSSSEIKFLALYFPQWYPATENNMMDDWRYFSNPNFTQNRLGHPIFRPRNHLYYDSRCRGIRETQAALAKKYLVDGFVYYFYWFDSHMLLEEVNERMLLDGQPDIDFAFMWVNEPFGEKYQVRYELNEVAAFARTLRKYFQHPKYIKMDGRPVLYVYLGTTIPDGYMEALKAELVSIGSPEPYVVTSIQIHYKTENVALPWANAYAEFPPNIGHLLASYGYTKYNHTDDYHLGLTVNFDNSPRQSKGNPNFLPRILSKRRFLPSTAAQPREFLRRCVSRITNWEQQQTREKVVLVYAWNEWSEQGALEPSDVHGYGFLEALRQCKQEVHREQKEEKLC